ncbi:hypothetical protein BDR03DRAFT_145615 [Suillus americanus]|nr:hypothetical protein BDR03DRAFT_145615 [Suillus americanus]
MGHPPSIPHYDRPFNRTIRTTSRNPSLYVCTIEVKPTPIWKPGPPRSQCYSPSIRGSHTFGAPWQ